jgi:cytochrome bd-type quinol oxidase subunit 1
MPGLIVPFLTFTILYIFLAFVTVWLLLRQVAASPKAPEPPAPEAQLAA